MSADLPVVVLEGQCPKCGTVRAQVDEPLRWGRCGWVDCPGCGRRVWYERVGRAIAPMPWKTTDPKPWNHRRRKAAGGAK